MTAKVPFTFPPNAQALSQQLNVNFRELIDYINENLGTYLVTTANTPAQITGNQNNYAPGEYGVLRLSTDASRTITGIADGVSGRNLWIVNVGSNNLTLSNQSASSSAANRIICAQGADMTLAADDVVHLWYDVTTARWRVFTTSDALWG